MLYDFAFLIFSVFYLPTLIFKGKLHGDFMERFGIYGESKEKALWQAKDVIWIQAVSVGEVALCKSLIPAMRKEFPDSSIVFSTITKTGNDLAKKLFTRNAIVIYFPLDFSFTVRRAVSKIHPKLYIMVETEIWPNVLKELNKRGVPSILINGRISDRSFGKYKFVRRFLRNTLGNIKVFCMQSAVDAERIQYLGGASDRVAVTGNMKFDTAAIGESGDDKAVRELFGFNADDEVFVAGSTHGGEEEAVVSVYKNLIKDHPKLKLIIAPRHVERSQEAADIVKRFGFSVSRMSEGRAKDVLIIDKIGYLNDAYSIAEIVFVGGSLIPHGGQNPIEPAALGKSVIFGPYMFNFKSASSALLDNGGAIQVKDEKEFTVKADNLLKDRAARALLGDNAKKIVCEGRGAASRNVEAVKVLVNG